VRSHPGMYFTFGDKQLYGGARANRLALTFV
jgi:hypothetical protein